MSASREKREREGIENLGLTQKQLKEAKEAKASKRNAIIYWTIGITCAVLVAALLVWNSGILQRGATAATIGSKNLSLADMQYYYGVTRNSEIQQQEMYAQYGITILSDPYVQYDGKSALGDQQIYDTSTSQTYADHFRESALKSAKQVSALVDAAKTENYTLSADGKTSLDTSLKSLKDQISKAGFPSFASYLTQYYGKYVTESIFNARQTDATLASEYQAHHNDSLTYTEDQLAAYQKENPAKLSSYDFRYCYIDGAPAAKTDADGKTVEATEEETAAALAAAKAKADALVAGVNADKGDKSDAFNKLVVDAVDATSSYATPDGNLQSNVLGSKLSSSPYYEWLTAADRKAGDISAVESGTGYYVLLFLKSGLNSTATVDVRHILIKAELTPADEAAGTAAATEPTDEQMAAAKTAAQALLDQFNALPEDQHTASAFGKLAKENSDDTGSASAGGLYRYVEVDTMVPTFNDWIFDHARKTGDTGLVENKNAGQYGYHVMYFVAANGPKWHELAETALKEKDMTTWMETIEAPYTATWTDGGAQIGK